MRVFKVGVLSLLMCLGFQACKSQPDPGPDNPEPEGFIRGADLSFLPEIEASGLQFKNQKGEIQDALSIFADAGCNTVRVRLWNNPSTPHSGMAEVLAFSQSIKAKGMKVWLDLHYSDSWADPGTQTKPAAWEGLTTAQLKDSVYAFTLKAIDLIQPEYVQIGNEINGGMLWNEGKVQNAVAFTDLLKSGTLAARQSNTKPQVMIHYAGISGADWFFDLLSKNQVDYDMIGISYYPLWHGKDLDSLSRTLNRLAITYHHPIVIAETAYPFSLGYADKTQNFIGQSDQILPAYPATPEGQEAFLRKIRTLVAQTTSGMGFCYWAPDWVAFKGENATNGSVGENLALFDFSFQGLRALGVYEK